MRSRLVVLLVTAVGCAATPPATGPALGERFPMRAGESVVIRGTPATITFDGILADSRCAIDVVCIQAGEARGAFRLATGRGPATAFELDSARNASAVVGDYRVTLVSVSPAPRSTVRIAPGDYIVDLSVGRAVDVSVQNGSSPPS